jgi:hypothetical protein
MPCSRLAAPASTAQSAELPPQVCTMTRAPPRSAVSTAARISSRLKLDASTASPGVAEPAVAISLIHCAPWSSARCAAARIAATLPAWAGPIMSTATCRRGPGSRPPAMASRSPASAPPASLALVTPPRKVAATDAVVSRALSSGSRLSRSSWWKSFHEMWVWQSYTPGMSHRPCASSTPGPGGSSSNSVKSPAEMPTERRRANLPFSSMTRALTIAHPCDGFDDMVPALPSWGVTPR